MELKLPRKALYKLLAKRSNRTFMELKLEETREDLNPELVLIVPLWN